MIQRPFLVSLTASSIILALSCMVSHWHPMHLSKVWHQGAQWLDLREGGMRWFLEARRGQYRAPPGMVCKGRFLPGRLGFRACNDGLRRVVLPGLSIEWWWQASGYRRFDVGVGFFTLAFLAALYPTVRVIAEKRRSIVRRRKGLCVSCAYDLTGNVSGICPECGTRILQ